jgi:hypothetical protein
MFFSNPHGGEPLGPMGWEFFAGACFLAGALLLRRTSSPLPVIAGMAFAGLLRIVWFRIRRAFTRNRKEDDD